MIDLPLDATLRVVLAENPGTGYRWQPEDKYSSCLDLVGRDFFAKPDQAIGAPGMAVFYFRPLRPGRCRLSLKLWRPWEGDQSVVRRFQAAVSIIPG